jgi:cytoskeletal protein CcmA (bactofilin family)
VGLSVSILAKPAEKRDDWKETLYINPGKEIDFLLVVANNSADELKDVAVFADLPGEIAYQDDLKINGAKAIGDITENITFSALPAGAIETITFRGKASINLEEKKEVEVQAQAKTDKIASSDNLKIEIGARGGLEAAYLLWGSLKDMFHNWLFWILLVIVLLITYLLTRNSIKEWRAKRKLAKAIAKRPIA